MLWLQGCSLQKGKQAGTRERARQKQRRQIDSPKSSWQAARMCRAVCFFMTFIPPLFHQHSPLTTALRPVHAHTGTLLRRCEGDSCTILTSFMQRVQASR